MVLFLVHYTAMEKSAKLQLVRSITVIDGSHEVVNDVEEMLEGRGAGFELTKKKCQGRYGTCQHRTDPYMLRKNTYPQV